MPSREEFLLKDLSDQVYSALMDSSSFGTQKTDGLYGSQEAPLGSHPLTGSTNDRTEVHTSDVGQCIIDEEETVKNGMITESRFYRIIRNSRLISTALTEISEKNTELDHLSKLRRITSKIANTGLLASTICFYINDIGPGTEWATAKIGKEAMELVAEHGNVSLSAATVGLAVGGFSAIYNSATGLAMNRNLKMFPKTVGVIRDSRLGSSSILMNSRQRSHIRRFTNVFTVGAATINLEDSITDPDFIKEKKGFKRTMNSAAHVAVGSIAIGAIGGGAVQHALNIGNLDLGYRILGHLTNPLYWTGLFVGGRCVDYAKNKKVNSNKAALLHE